MSNYTLKTESLPFSFVALSFLLGFYAFPKLPEKVASHWNFQGQVDGFSGPLVGAFGVPALMLGMYLLFLALPYLDPKKERYQEFASVYSLFRSAILFVLLVIYGAMIFFNLGYNIQINYVVPFAIGVLFLVIGNYMGKIKPNWFVGVRTPWALSSEDNWNRTNRFGGKMMMLCGLLMMITPFLAPTLGLVSFIAGILLVALGSPLYSYLIYRKQKTVSQ
jgi:uncharacterized membrane protein